MKLLLLFLLTSFTAFSQVDFVKEYYPEINKAEMCLTNENYSEALNHYQNAFKITKKPFKKDIFNAFVCKTLLSDFNSAKPFLMSLALNGTSPDFVDKCEIIKKDNNYESWKKFRTVYSQIYESSLNSPISALKDLDSLSLRSFKNQLKVDFYEDKLANDTLALISHKNYNKRILIYNPDLKLDTAFYNVSDKSILKSELDSLKTLNLEFSNMQNLLFKKLLENIDEYNEHNFERPNAVNWNYNFYYLGQNVLLRNTINLPVELRKKLSQDNDVYCRNKLKEAVKRGIFTNESIISLMDSTELFRIPVVGLVKIKVDSNTDCSKSPLFDKIYLEKKLIYQPEINKYNILAAKYGFDNYENRVKKELYFLRKNKYFYYTPNSYDEILGLGTCEEAYETIKYLQVYEN